MVYVTLHELHPLIMEIFYDSAAQP